MIFLQINLTNNIVEACSLATLLMKPMATINTNGLIKYVSWGLLRGSWKLLIILSILNNNQFRSK